MRTGRLAAFWKGRGGVTATEFALVAPMALLLIWMTIEVSWQIWLKNALDNAVIDASRCHAIGYKDTASAIDCTATTGSPSLTTYVQAHATGVPFTTANTFAVTVPSSSCVNYSYQAVWLSSVLSFVTAPAITGYACFNY